MTSSSGYTPGPSAIAFGHATAEPGPIRAGSRLRDRSLPRRSGSRLSITGSSASGRARPARCSDSTRRRRFRTVAPSICSGGGLSTELLRAGWRGTAPVTTTSRYRQFGRSRVRRERARRRPTVRRNVGRSSRTGRTGAGSRRRIRTGCRRTGSRQRGAKSCSRASMSRERAASSRVGAFRR